jgi:hypothetical protein
MPRDETALVLVLPEDGADVILNKLRTAGARSVQLLVADGAVALRRPEVAARIRELALAEGVEVTLISSDEPTVAAARAAGLQTMVVQRANVRAPSRSARGDLPATPYSTNVIERRQPPAPPARAAARDDLDAGMPPAPASADADLYAALEGLSAALEDDDRRKTGLSDADLLAANLSAEPEPAAPPRARVRPEDVELSPDEIRRANRAAAGTAPQPRPASTAAPTAPQARPAPGRREPVGAPRRRGALIFALIAGLLALLLVIGGLLLWTSRVTVIVGAPVRSDSVETFTALPVPLAPAGSAAGGTAVVAEPISTDAAAQQTGEVTQGTLTPSGTASGLVNILNSTTQSILLPAGTEFIAVKADGQEVPFISGAEVLVPGATTADQGAQIVTTRGQAQVPVTARSPGSGSNVEANAIRRISPPGGPTFNANAGSLIVTNDPIGGGSEQEVRIVKDSDVQAILAPALEALDAAGRSQLDGLARARNLVVAPDTIIPRRSDLEQLQGFDYTVTPAVGSTLDTANPRFTLAVQASYSALATPPDRPMDGQLGAVVTEQLRQAGKLQPGDCRAPVVTAWRWDGQSLLIDGQVEPDTQSPQCQGGLDAAALDQVRAAVRGKTREEADVALQALVEQGVIGEYTLPDVSRMPQFGWQITVRGE